MVLKIYGLVWALGVLAVGITYLTGNFNLLMMIIFGFLSFGALFLGGLFVLPAVFEPRPQRKH